MENAKVYVEVLVSFDKDGTMSQWNLSGKMEKNIMWTVSLQGNAVQAEKQAEPGSVIR